MKDQLASEYKQAHDLVDEILHYIWDPIGIAGNAGARDEYSSYVPAVVKLLFDEASETAICGYLLEVERNTMELSLPVLGSRRRKHTAKTLLDNFHWLMGHDKRENNET